MLQQSLFYLAGSGTIDQGMSQDSPASSYGSAYGRWRWIQQHCVQRDRLRQTRNGVDYVLVSKVANPEEENFSEEVER